MTKRQASRRPALAGLLILWVAPTGMATTIIDFEEWAGGHASAPSFSSRGFVLTCDTMMQVIQDPSDGSRDGSVTLRNFRSSEIVLSKQDGKPFDLLAVDLGEGKTEAPSTRVDIVGQRADGSLVSTVVALDGLLPTFQTVRIERFDNVMRVSFRGDSATGFSMDNIVVPEPTSLCLLIAGVMSVIGPRRYRAIPRTTRACRASQ